MTPNPGGSVSRVQAEGISPTGQPAISSKNGLGSGVQKAVHGGIATKVRQQSKVRNLDSSRALAEDRAIHNC